MYGFDILINFTKTESILSSRNAKIGRDDNYIKHNDIIVCNNMIGKFCNDKLFYQSDDYIIILDGVIVNKKVLMKEMGFIDNWMQCVVSLYETQGEQFFKKFEGSFSGALYDKKKDRLIVFSDHIGSKFLYYSAIGDKFICSSDICNIYEYFRKEGVNYTLSSEGAFMLLTYGFIVDGVTLCNQIKKIKPGCYLTIENGKVAQHQYYIISGLPNDNIGSEDDIVEQVDQLFRNAIVKHFEKDREYGYKHMANLSGGLDSRMTVWVANEMGYKDQLNLTFSQTGYYDATIPEKIASDLGHEWLFKSLDGGRWLYDVDETVNKTGGEVLYFGQAHGRSLSKYLNHNGFGMVHTGMLGDVVLGSTYYQSKPFVFGDGAYSRRYISNIDYKIETDYSTPEMTILYVRGFDGINCGVQPAYHDIESLSPFCDLELMEYAFSIPVSLRLNHKLYRKWVIRKYPEAAKYPWSQIEGKITNPLNFIRIKGIPIAGIPSRVYKKIMHKTTSNFSMNPIGYYLATNDSLWNYLLEYYKYADSITDNRLRSVVLDIKQNGKPVEKIQAVTLLSAIKQFYI